MAYMTPDVELAWLREAYCDYADIMLALEKWFNEAEWSTEYSYDKELYTAYLKAKNNL